MAKTLWRVRDRTTFHALRVSRCRARRGPVAVTCVPGPPGQPPRVAFAVGRRTGGAVTRNLLKRRLRSIASDLGLPPGAYLITAAPEAAALSYGALQALVREATSDLSGRP